jgi:hypothetical protein
MLGWSKDSDANMLYLARISCMGGVEMQWNRSISYTSHTNHSHNLKLQEYCQLFFYEQ